MNSALRPSYGYVSPNSGYFSVADLDLEVGEGGGRALGKKRYPFSVFGVFLDFEINKEETSPGSATPFCLSALTPYRKYTGLSTRATKAFVTI